ncbi:hypothetical protein PVAND_002197 [Polypedilum vanderplanki]|uniref:AB hydrolase-1 domain-containing protein n=1 Tax=Polypedilum vanderplanki TaxID=319348 RepID=A0A9J6BRH0_POLVA|nr:hypothetical protein PVAND_002197 [Polypedilum vanderplanki]
MKYLVRGPRRIYKYFYSNANERQSHKTINEAEPYDLLTDQEIEFEVEEVRIPLPFGGQLAGKFWGDKSLRPIVLIHGWQDNAGTFDRLIPLLPKQFSYLAIDLPGHGLSDWIPDGMQYHNAADNLYVLHNLMKEYNWDKISLIGHSMGSQIAFVFASIFPSKVDFVIGIDALKPAIHDPVLVSQILEDRIENFMIADKRNQEKSEPPAYAIEEMIEKLVDATGGSVTKDSAQYLLKRNIKRSEKYPGKFFFARDSRLKYSFTSSFPQEVCVELAKRIDMPYMFIKAKQSPYYEKKQYHEQVVDVLTKNPKFEYHLVDSTHHLHLSEPEKVSGIISEFLMKYKTPKGKL